MGMRKMQVSRWGYFIKHVILWEFQWKSNKFIFISQITRMIKTMHHKTFLKYLNMKLHTAYCELSKHHSKTWKSNQRPGDNAVTKMELIIDTQPELICRHKDRTQCCHKDRTDLPSQRQNLYAVTRTGVKIPMLHRI